MSSPPQVPLIVIILPRADTQRSKNSCYPGHCFFRIDRTAIAAHPFAIHTHTRIVAQSDEAVAIAELHVDAATTAVPRHSGPSPHLTPHTPEPTPRTDMTGHFA